MLVLTVAKWLQFLKESVHTTDTNLASQEVRDFQAPPQYQTSAVAQMLIHV